MSAKMLNLKLTKDIKKVNLFKNKERQLDIR